MEETFAKAHDFIAKEEGIKQAFEARMSELQRIASGGFASGVEKVGPVRAECESQAPQLAPQFRTQAASALSGFDAQWQTYRSNKLEESLSRGEEIVAGVKPADGPERVLDSFKEIKTTLAAAAPLLAQPPELPGAVAGRLSRIKAEVQKWTNTASKWEEAKAALPGASTLEDYLKSLDQIVLSPFAGESVKTEVAKVGGFNISMQSLLGQLLLPNDPTNWSTLTNASDWNMSLMPEGTTDAEKDFYFKLRDDPNAININLYKLEADPHPGNRNMTHNVYVRGTIDKQQNGGDFAGTVYDPAVDPHALRFVSRSYSTYDFHVSPLQRTAESDTYERLGFGNLIDSNNYQKPILQLLDELNSDSEASAVFRAYATFRLWAIAQVRPEKWGLPWCPAAAAHIQALSDLGAGNIKSGDWLVAERKRKIEAKLQDYFDKAKAKPMEKQARFLQQLVHDTCVKGFSYAGYVDADGKPVFRSPPVGSVELCGWNRAGEAVLFRRDGDSGTFAQPSDPQPYSPLFIFAGNRSDLLKQTLKATGYQRALAEHDLPPFYGGLP